MPRTSYLESLTTRLAEGATRLPAAFTARHTAYLQGCQNPDGGFSGREGGSDLYYTGFALRGLAVLGALTSETCTRAASFLRQSLTQQASVIDLFSLLYAGLLVQIGGGPEILAESPSDWPERVAVTLESMRTADGGYAKAPGIPGGSTYHTFLVALSYELLGRSLPRPEDAVRFLQSRQREDGGFVEIAPMRRSGTNPTAAAVGTLQLLAQESDAAARLLDTARPEIIGFLAEMPSLEGGLRANTRVPLADLLSTFTGGWTLHQLDALERIGTGEARGYAEGLESPTGGFRGGLWDERVDVEYSFYGLGVLALLS
jgi:geranylgeranyl transferase type-2 subunit beta